MAIFPFAELARQIQQLLARIQRLERQEKIRLRQELTGAAEQEQDNPGENVGFNTHFFHTTIVQTVDEGNKVFTALRVVPDVTSLWVVDSDLATKPVTVTFPENVGVPNPGEVAQVFFTGIFSTANSPSLQVRYGLFGAGGGDLRQYILTKINTDTLECKEYSTLNNTVVAANTPVQIALPFELRRTPWHGNTIGGITYTYASPTQRTATGTPGSEIQIIIPTFVVSFTLIMAQRAVNGTGIQSVTLQDVNVGGRMWAKLFA